MSRAIGQRVQKLREAAGLSKAQLGGWLRLTGQAVGAIESGKVDPSWRTIRLLAQAFGVPVEHFDDGAAHLASRQPPRPGRSGRPRKEQA